jgi:hypothetical protein
MDPPIILNLSQINPIPCNDTIYLRSILTLYSYLGLFFSRCFFPVCLPVKILKELLPSSILATCSAYLNLIDLINLIILSEWYKL